MTKARVKTGDVVREHGNDEQLVVVFATDGREPIIIAGRRAGECRTIEQRDLTVLTRRRWHSHGMAPDELCHGCVQELDERAQSCSRCTGALAVLIDPSRAAELSELVHSEACDAPRG